MSPFKSLLEPKCGGASDLSQLSNAAYGNTDLQPEICASVQDNFIISRENDFASDYLARVSVNSELPLDFDVGTVLNCLRKQRGHSNSAISGHHEPLFEGVWKGTLNIYRPLRAIESRSDSISQYRVPHWNWADEYSKIKLNDENPSPYTLASNEGICSINSSISAAEFLQNYDLNSLDSVISDSWQREFLEEIANKGFDRNNFISEFIDSNFNNSLQTPNISPEYSFNLINPYINGSNNLEKAKEMLSSGRIVDAILCYEAEIQKNPYDAELWYLLGISHAENENDSPAISALKNSLDLNPTNCKVILAMAVSLINEGHDVAAMQELDKWICIYSGNDFVHEPSISIQNTFNTSLYLDRDKMNSIENKFLTTLRQKQNIEQHADPELQNALSVFYNLSNRLDRAVDCIKIALSSDLKNATLWNRLGATLANAERSMEAKDAYMQAINICPSHVRARFNLGISHMKLGEYRQAANAFIGALKIQSNPGSSPQIWSRLRSSIIRTEDPGQRKDVIEMINNRDVDKLTKIFL